MNPCRPGPSRTARLSPPTVPNWQERSRHGANSRGCHSLRRNGLLRARAPESSPNVVRRHLERARRSALRIGAVEFSRTVRCSRYAARRHKVRRLARPPARPPASRPAAEKNEGVESNRPPRRHALLCVLCGMSLRTQRSKASYGSGSPAYRPNARNEFSAWPTTSV